MNLSRREFIPASASFAGVALAGRAFAGDRKCTSDCTPPPPPVRWKEDPLTIELRVVDLTPPHMKVREAHSVHALTADSWDTLGNHFQAFADEHSRLGNLHLMDLAIEARQVKLKERFGRETVDYIMEHGVHAMMTVHAEKCHAVATKLRHDIQPLFPTCGQEFGLNAALMDIMGLVLILQPELALFFTVASIIIGLMGVFMCG